MLEIYQKFAREVLHVIRTDGTLFCGGTNHIFAQGCQGVEEASKCGE